MCGMPSLNGESQPAETQFELELGWAIEYLPTASPPKTRKSFAAWVRCQRNGLPRAVTKSQPLEATRMKHLGDLCPLGPHDSPPRC